MLEDMVYDPKNVRCISKAGERCRFQVADMTSDISEFAVYGIHSENRIHSEIRNASRMPSATMKSSAPATAATTKRWVVFASRKKIMMNRVIPLKSAKTTSFWSILISTASVPTTTITFTTNQSTGLKVVLCRKLFHPIHRWKKNKFDFSPFNFYISVATSSRCVNVRGFGQTTFEDLPVQFSKYFWAVESRIFWAPFRSCTAEFSIKGINCLSVVAVYLQPKAALTAAFRYAKFSLEWIYTWQGRSFLWWHFTRSQSNS